jgi:peptide subunit release factor 1 (eRF1)
MITPEELKKLNKIKTKTPTVSLYLNADQKYNTPDKILIKLKNLLKKSKSIIGEENYKKVLDQARLAPDRESKGVVYFLNPKEDIAYSYKLNKPFVSQIHIENNLHLKPLFSMFDEYERYYTVVLDKEKAKIFSVYLGEIEDLSEVFNDFPGKHDQGGLSQGNFERHLEAIYRRNLREIVDKIRTISKRRSFDRLIIAGSKEILPEFVKMLPSDLKSKLAGEFCTELFENNQHFLDQSLKIEEEIERKKEKEQVKLLVENLGDGNKAISGLDEVLQASFEKKVMKLIVKEGWQKPGYVCTNCDKLIYKEDNCKQCGDNKEEVEDVIDELVQQVIAQGGEVEFVEDSEELEKIGNVGALLRY